MKCYFCGRDASVLCQKCGRYVCNTHSRRINERFFCIEDALGGLDAVFNEAYKTALTYVEHQARKCSICGKKHLPQVALDNTIRENYGLDCALELKIEQKLLQEGVVIDKPSSAELTGPECHNFCANHFPKPTRTYKIAESKYTASGYDYSFRKCTEFQCPVCKAKWVVMRYIPMSD